MCKLKYSIIYAVVRPEISERISVGIIMVDGKTIDVRYSDAKLKALELLYPKAEYEFVSKAVRSMNRRNVLKNEQDIEYLSRYSNNLLSISHLQTIDIEACEKIRTGCTNRTFMVNLIVSGNDGFMRCFGWF